MHDRPHDFLDAERIFRTLQAVEMARDLYVSAAEKFAVAPGEDALSLDRAAFSYLLSEAFVEVPADLQSNIERYRDLDEATARIREQLKEVYTRIKLTRARIEKLGEELGLGLLASTKKKWELRSRQEQHEQELEQLQLQRQRLEGELERAGGVLRDLQERVQRDPALRTARWFHERPVIITHFGEFLLDYLGDMNQGNFRGRSLAEIIEIGPALA